MKKILCLIITVTLFFTSASIAYAKSNNSGGQNDKKVTQDQKNSKKATKQIFKINESPVIKYGKYKLPISPVSKGMGATVTYDKTTTVLTVVKDTKTIVINFNTKTVTVNGTAVTDSGIFTAKNDEKMTVLIQYIASVLGVKANVDKDEVTIEVPGFDLPKNVTVTPAGTTVTAKSLNNTTLYLTASANITTGQATGGKAELYVGNKLVATDAVITSDDTSVTFTTSDSTPTNAELQAAVPTGGVVTVKLYNANNEFVISAVANPVLIVDYVAPTITSVTSAIYKVDDNQLYIIVTGVGAIKDIVDVTKISLIDSTLGKSYQLTNTSDIGSKGEVYSVNSLLINIGSADKLGLAGFGSTTMSLTISTGSLLKDLAGNVSLSFPTSQTVPVTIIN